jgi:hypothetical protein
MHAVRRDPELKRFYRRKLIQKGLGKARVAVAHKLGTDSGSCCGTRLTIKSSVVVDSGVMKTVVPVRGCQKPAMVRNSHRQID